MGRERQREIGGGMSQLTVEVWLASWCKGSNLAATLRTVCMAVICVQRQPVPALVVLSRFKGLDRTNIRFKFQLFYLSVWPGSLIDHKVEYKNEKIFLFCLTLHTHTINSTLVQHFHHPLIFSSSKCNFL